MKKTLLIPAIASILLFSACEKDVEIKVPEKDPSLVLVALQEKGEFVVASVGRSRHILEPQPGFDLREHYSVKNAQVVLYEDGTAIDTLVYDHADYIYESKYNRVMRDGHAYSIKANAPGFREVTSETTVPSQSEIVETRWNKNVRTNSYGETIDEVIIRINDPGAERNFYLIKVFQPSMNGYGEFPVGCVSTTDKDIETIGYETDPGETDECLDGGNLLMKDLNFNGGQKLVKLNIVSSFLDNMWTDTNTGQTSRHFVKVYRITESHFKFAKSYNVFDNADDNPFAEPVNVYTNVKNGYGIFSAFTVAVDSLR